jgi:hypothetical protein
VPCSLGKQVRPAIAGGKLVLSAPQPFSMRLKAHAAQNKAKYHLMKENNILFRRFFAPLVFRYVQQGVSTSSTEDNQNVAARSIRADTS